MRIVSLLPGTTEITCKLGLGNHLVGRSHECDYPPEVISLPVLTRPKCDLSGNSLKIDDQVKSLLKQGLSIYDVDAEQLAELEPDVILTQDHCEVCAVSLPDVERAAKESTGRNATIISVSPTDLDGIFESVLTIGGALQVDYQAKLLVNQMQHRVDLIRNRTMLERTRQSVLCIEWIDPIMTAGNWIPELVEIAGGNNLLSEAGRHSPWADWSDILIANPETILIMPCGYNFDQTLEELPRLFQKPGWSELRAVRQGKVFILDGNQFFNRPGPRIVESTRILAEILHPHLFEPAFKNVGWKSMEIQMSNIRSV